MAKRFLLKHFPPAKTAKLRNKISSYIQMDSETLYETWETFQGVVEKKSTSWDTHLDASANILQWVESNIEAINKKLDGLALWWLASGQVHKSCQVKKCIPKCRYRTRKQYIKVGVLFKLRKLLVL